MSRSSMCVSSRKEAVVPEPQEADDGEAQPERVDLVGVVGERPTEVLLGHLGHGDPGDEQRHRDAEDAVAEADDAAELHLAAVVLTPSAPIGVAHRGSPGARISGL
jgi:hypothetical protein